MSLVLFGDTSGQQTWNAIMTQIQELCTKGNNGLLCDAFNLTLIATDCALETVYLLQQEEPFDSTETDEWWIDVGIPLTATCLGIYLCTVFAYWLMTRPRASYSCAKHLPENARSAARKMTRQIQERPSES